MQMTALCVVASLLALVLKRATPELGLLLTVGTAVVLLLALLESLGELTAVFRQLAECSGMERALMMPLYKAVGIALVVNVGSNLCRDAGESALAAVVEMAGAVCTLLVALPLVQTVLNLLLELMT